MTLEEELERCKRKRAFIFKVSRQQREARVRFTAAVALLVGVQRQRGEPRAQFEARILNKLEGDR